MAELRRLDRPQGLSLDALEMELRRIWCELLDLEHIGRGDDFFALGGHSLLAMQAVQRLQVRCGVRIPVSTVFEYPTMASLMAVLRERANADSGDSVCEADAGAEAGPGPPGPITMSRAQRGVWFMEQLGGNAGAYLLPEVWDIRGPLQVDALQASLSAVVAHHPALRTRFRMAGDLPVQAIDEPRPVDLPILDLRSLSEPARQAELDRLALEQASRPFDLSRDWLLRAQLAVLGEEHHVLFVTTHHIASDAHSQQILRQEVGARYRQFRRGERLPVEEPPARSGDRLRPTPARDRALREYWRGQLRDLPPLELPSDRERPERFSYRGAEQRFSLPADLTAALRRVADEHRVTLPIVLLAAYQVLLARLSGQTDFGVATPVAGADGLDRLIGLHVNVFVTRADLSGDPDFVELLARVRRAWLSGYDHADLPFDTVVAELKPSRDLRRMPLAQAMFQLVPFDDGVPDLEGLEVTRVRYAASCVRFDLEFTVWQEGAGLTAALGYCTDVFESGSGARLAGYYRTLLEAVVADPHRDVSTLPILGPGEREQQLAIWSGIAAVTPVDADETIHGRFASQVAQTSDSTAVRFGATRLTYRELDERANQLAHHLLELGVRHEEPVGIYLPRSAETVIAMLAILKAGAAYVPLDVRHPEERLAFILGDAGVRTLITGSAPPRVLEQRVQRVVAMAEYPAWASHATAAPRGASSPLDLAYLIYTSGSTGRPKGVAVTHQAVVRLVRQTNYVQLSTADRIAQAANTSFDAATFEIWGALLNGAELVGVSTETLLSAVELARAITEAGLTTLFLTPALFSQLAAEDPAMFAPLRYLVVGGDVLDPRAVRAVLAAGAPQHLINGYGPTENTTFSACFDCVGLAGGLSSIPIGRPIANSTCYVLDGHGALLPLGAIGELYVGGKGLARGYLHRPELTAERFVPHPFMAGERLYRTGDRARWRDDGTLDFRGRIDRQVKLRGHRIEPGEIECALGEHEAVEQSFVIVQERAGERRLVAYWVPRAGQAAAAQALSEFLRRRLPSYMAPAAFVELAQFPLTVNGKLDVAALPAPRGAPGKASTGASPAAGEPPGELESRIEAVWRRLLGVERIGLHEDFFACGGTSLLAVQVVARLRQELGRPVSIGDLFAFPTIAGLAGALKARPAGSGGASVVLTVIHAGGGKPPLIFPPGLAGDAAVLDAVRAVLPSDQPVYALHDFSDGPRQRSIEAMATEYCEAVRARWPHGPIHLAGYSYAGILAYEMARQLAAGGYPIGLLAVIDTGPGGGSRQGPLQPARALWGFARNLPRWVYEDLMRAAWREAPGRLWRSTGKLVKELLGRGASSPFRPAATDLFDVRGWTESQRAQVDLNLRALGEFTFRPYPGRLVLLRASTWPLFHTHRRDLGWRGLVPELRIIDVPGNHVTILRSPRVEALARTLGAALEEASAAVAVSAPIPEAGIALADA